MPHLTVPSPLGPITLQAHNGAITSLSWGTAVDDGDPQRAAAEPVLALAASQLSDWFGHRRRDFTLPLRPNGTTFQQRVWAALSAIPYGSTVTYGGLASQLDNAARAVGTACGRNPLPIVIPCHRVVGTGGLGGYSAPGGLEAKRWLLDHECPP